PNRSSPRPRLPRRLLEELRWTRQLHPWPPRSTHLRRDRLRQGRQAQGHERHLRHYREGRQRCSRSAQGFWNALPRRSIKKDQQRFLNLELKIESKKHGNHCKARQRRKETEVQIPPAQPLPALRPPPSLPPEVRCLPSLLPLARSQGRNSGRSQVKLVEYKHPCAAFRRTRSRDLIRAAKLLMQKSGRTTRH